jgi:hypothetical protein
LTYYLSKMEGNTYLVKLVFTEEDISSSFLFESRNDKLFLSTDFGGSSGDQRESIAPCIDMSEGFFNEEFDHKFKGNTFKKMTEELSEYTASEEYYERPYAVAFNDASAGVLYDHLTVQMILNPKSGTIYCDFDTGIIKGEDDILEYDIPTTGPGVISTNYKCIIESLLN